MSNAQERAIVCVDCLEGYLILESEVRCLKECPNNECIKCEDNWKNLFIITLITKSDAY